MKNGVDWRLWQLPRWLQYASSIVVTGIFIAIRFHYHEFLGDRGSLAFFTLPVAFAAFMGGFGPGIVATTMSIVLGVYFFVKPYHTWTINDTPTLIAVTAFATNWTFLCIICQLLRNAAFSYRQTAIERDEERAKSVNIIESISDGFLTVDNDWKVTHANRALGDIFELGSEELVSRNLWDILPVYVLVVRDSVTACKNKSETLAIDLPQPSTSGKWLHLRGFPDRHGLTLYIQDVTERKERDVRMARILADERRARSDAERASRLRDEFVATLSHELRTPLTSILGWSELLQVRKLSDERLTEGLAAIERSTRLQSRLIEELLDMSRMSSGKVRLDMQVLLLSEVIDESVAVCSAAALNKSIQLDLDLCQEDLVVRADPGRLQQVITNVLLNAVKFTPRGGRVCVKLRKNDTNAVIQVEDNGEGIPPSFMPFVFDRFRQADASITRSQGGLGLGLSIAKKLIELHGGSIRADSPGIGLGSIFTIILPLSPTKSTNGTAALAQDKQAPLVGIRVLVVDDDEDTRSLISVMLTESGADVWASSSGENAIPSLKEFEPDVLVSDIGMPGFDGYQLIGAVRALPAEDGGQVPAVALTAFAREEDKERSLSAGYQAHLCKPVDLAVLVDVIWKLATQTKKSVDDPMVVDATNIPLK